MKHKLLFRIILTCLTLILLQSCASKTPLQHFKETPRGQEDIAGWEKARWGMTVEEVNAIYSLKGTFKPDDGLFESGLQKVDVHFYKNHIIPSSLYWDKLPTVASFYFDKHDPTGKLVRVKVIAVTEFGKLKFNQSPISSFFRFLIKKYGWPYQYHPVKGKNATNYFWRAQSGMIQLRHTKTEIKGGMWNHIFTINYLSKTHPYFGNR